MSIQWFPGHMTKARRQIQEKLKLIDVVIELLDARIPNSSRNPMIDEVLQGKPRLVVLNKFSLADPQVTEKWVAFFEKNGLSSLPIDSISGTNVRDILPRCKQLLSDKIAAQQRRGMNPRSIRALIVGIPNVGKSTLINRLASRQVAATGDRPGVTKGQQWIRAGNGLELLDTPGILWPKFEDPEVGLRLAVTGAIKEEILHLQDVGFYAVRYLLREYPHVLPGRYGLEALAAEMASTDLADPDTIVNWMEQIGRKRGCLQSGGIVNLEQTSGVILRDLRSGKLGRISVEAPVAGGTDA